MSPETDANDHVPLEFLLGARVKYYVTSTAKHKGGSSKAKRIFAPSVHPRRREEHARQLLQRVLEQNDLRRIDYLSESEVLSPQDDRAALLKTLAKTTSTQLADQEAIFNEENFQLSFDDAIRSPARIKTLQQLRDDDLRRQNQRVASFHGYEQHSKAFLDVTGSAARIPHTTTRQLRDLKVNVVKEKKKLEVKRKQELVEILQQQQEHTRTAHHQQQQLAKALQRQKHPGVVSTNLLTLDSIGKHDNGNNVNEWNEIPERRTKPLLQLQEQYYQQYSPEELEIPRRPILATLNIDAQVLSPPPSKYKRVVDSDLESHSVSTNNEEETQYSSEDDDDLEHVRKRLGDRQREVFAVSAANGLFLGGGFVSKKNDKKTKLTSSRNNSSNRVAQAANEREFLETVLGAQSASILPLAEANKPALRRREASAGRRHPKAPSNNK